MNLTRSLSPALALTLALGSLLTPAVQASPVQTAPAQQAPQQVLTPAAAVTRLLSSPAPLAEWFAPEFLAQVPLEPFAAQVASITQPLARFLRLDDSGGRLLAVFERGGLIVTAPLDAQGRFTGLYLAPGPASGEQRAAQVRALNRLFSAPSFDPAQFSPEFLAAVPAPALEQVLRATTTTTPASS